MKWGEEQEPACPKRGSLKSAGKRCRKAPLSCSAAFSMLQHSFALAATQLLVKMNFRAAEMRMLQCNFCIATFRKLQRNFCFRLWYFAGVEFRGVGLTTCWNQRKKSHPKTPPPPPQKKRPFWTNFSEQFLVGFNSYHREAGKVENSKCWEKKAGRAGTKTTKKKQEDDEEDEEEQ